jgi:hypothetical protein
VGGGEAPEDSFAAEAGHWAGIIKVRTRSARASPAEFRGVGEVEGLSPVVHRDHVGIEIYNAAPPLGDSSVPA